jgi:hypothetical protein
LGGGDGDLLEVPLSAAYIGGLRSMGGWLFPASASVPKMRGLLSRAGLLTRVALTPEEMPLPEVTRAIEALLADGTQYLSISSIRRRSSPVTRPTSGQPKTSPDSTVGGMRSSHCSTGMTSNRSQSKT